MEPDDDKTRTHVVLTRGTMVSHYRIVEKIGAGGMGEVYLAEDTELDRKVALKFLPPHLCQDHDCRERFKREAQAAGRLDHPNIVTVHEVGEYQGRPYFAMAHIEGQSLKEYYSGKELSLDQILELGIQICDGLQAAHGKGITHRDIKPSNILIDLHGRVRIVDFGLASVVGKDQLTKTGSTLGTVGYMSPEQVQGKEIDHRSDLFSLGVILYELITRQNPFKRDNEVATIKAVSDDIPHPLARYRSGIPDDLQRVIDKTLNKNADARYQTATDIIGDLRGVRRAVESGMPPERYQPSIAVLPFTNMSADEEQEYFCDGMTEDITNDLTHVEGLRVAARTSAFAFKGKLKDIREIGRKLNVETLLEGSVRKAGNRLRITAQLLNVADGYHLWSERYDRELEDVFAIQDEISRSIVQALKVTLNRNEERVLEKVATKDIQAYDFYLRGRRFFYLMGRKNIEYAMEMFSRAIKKDQNYALAYAGIAICRSWLFMYHGGDKTNIGQALEASRKALELDPTLAETRVSHGLALSLEKRFDDAESEFEKGLQLNPKLYDAYYFFARTCFVQGKFEKAAQLYEKACLIDPEDYQAPILLAGAYYGLDEKDKQKNALRQGLVAAERRLELHPDDARALYLGAQALIRLGEPEKGLRWARRALSISPNNPGVLYNVACLCSKLAKIEEAIGYLEKAVANGFAHTEWLEKDRDLDPLRSHPQYKALLKKLK